MYKVFIDHKPIIFVNDHEIIADFLSVHESELSNFADDIGHYLDKVSIDRPLQIICASTEESFERFFAEYELVEAAGGIVHSAYGYLVIKRNGLWDLPKGKIETGENKEEAAIREIEEECGIKNPEINGYIIETYHTFQTESGMIMKKTYWYSLTYSGSKGVLPQQEEGISQVEWMSEKALFEIKANTYGSINEVLDRFKDKFLTD